MLSFAWTAASRGDTTAILRSLQIVREQNRVLGVNQPELRELAGTDGCERRDHETRREHGLD